jgi:hypothetical protein
MLFSALILTLLLAELVFHIIAISFTFTSKFTVWLSHFFKIITLDFSQIISKLSSVKLTFMLESLSDLLKITGDKVILSLLQKNLGRLSLISKFFDVLKLEYQIQI